MKTYAYGFPRLGENREYKRVIESYWKKEISDYDLEQALYKIQESIIAAYQSSVDGFPVEAISGYDPMLDTAIITGVYPVNNCQEYYELCRGRQALEMTKWFNTNYHYLVPDFSSWSKPNFKLHMNIPLKFKKRFPQGIPSMIGPLTFLKLSKGIPTGRFNEFLENVAEVYRQVFATVGEVHVDEPALVLDLTKDEIKACKKAYQHMAASGAKIHLFTYYDQVDFLKELYAWPVASLGLDFVRGKDYLKTIEREGFPADKTLIAGVVDGRNVWRNDIKNSVQLIKRLNKKVKHLWVSNAAPLFHLPITTKGQGLDPRLESHLAFAKEKLGEIRQIADSVEKGLKLPVTKAMTFGQNKSVQKKVAGLARKDFVKKVSLEKRRKTQDKIFQLPLLPTTTIGSFPQTSDVRQKRSDVRSGKITPQEYDNYVQSKIREAVDFQEKLGLDVLVHGEFERTDMVEFFAEKLEGIATTAQGWIISYGTRAYRPPIIFGDVFRPQPMTVKEIKYAQSLTSKPVKGMLTGPVTIIAWSFVREDIPIKNVAYQIALALQDEIRDYEQAGIKIVQVDEPAIRERAPIKHRQWPQYFDWAVNSFRLATNTDATTQIHTHMCYSEFGEIIDHINDMDFDVISIETTRSRADIIRHFEKIKFRRQIGLGVWDIHSPAVPTVDEMKEVAKRALKVIPKKNFWINPDCGLKTRGWPETEASLKNLVTLARQLRQ